MGEIVERVARAIRDASGDILLPWGALSAEQRAPWVAKARAAIAAMAEYAVSDAALKIGGSTFWNARGTWQERTRAAIDAALAERERVEG